MLADTKDGPDALAGFVHAGTLVARSDPGTAAGPSLTIDVQSVSGAMVHRAGDLARVQGSWGEMGFVFAADLDASPVRLDVTAVCRALTPQRASGLCPPRSTLLLLNAVEGEARLVAAITPLEPPRWRLALLRLAASAPPVATSALDVTELLDVRQVALPHGVVLLVSREQFNAGAESGTAYAFFLVDAAGVVRRALTVPAHTSEPRGGAMIQRHRDLTIDRAGARPAILLEGYERIDDLAPGERRAGTPRRERVMWDPTGVELFLKPVPVR